MRIAVSKQQARRFLLTKQLLLPPKSLKPPDGIGTVFSKIRVIQYDPLNPCGRNPDLVLQARIQNYHPNEYLQWLYEEKKGIECYDKELCIIPIDDFSLTSHHRNSFAIEKHVTSFLKKYQREIEEIFFLIEKKGAITSADIINKTKIASGWGVDATFGRMALEILWKLGRLVIVKRENGKKYYGVSEKHHPTISETSVGSQLTTEHVRRRLQSVGILPLSGGGGGWQGLANIREIINQLVKQGEFVEVTVKDSKRVYVISTEDVESLSSSIPLRQKRMSFIAPLDTLMWDRDMIYDFFGFHYRWEVYTPKVKRNFGYYVLPILYGDEFIGRVEPVLRNDTILEIKGIWKEERSSWDNVTIKAFGETLSEFSTYLRAQSIHSSFSII